MNIYQFAMQMEKDGERFYRDLADKSANPGVRRILNMLADDEVKHYAVVKEMATQADPEMAETAVLASAKNVFAQMQGTEFDLEGMQVELFREGQAIERRSQAFYEEQAERATAPVHKALFLRIADEEKRHYFLLDAIVEFMDRPRTWIENAEFSHLEDY